MNSLAFSLAGLCFRVDAAPGLPPLSPPEEYRLFLQDTIPPTPHARYEARAAEDLVTTCPSEGILWDNGLWRSRRANPAAIEIDILNPRANAWQRSATLSPDFATGTLWAPRDSSAPVLRPLYHPQDRAVILGRLCHLEGIMLHASSVMAEGRVLVFAGMSGAGKTTMGRLWRDHGGALLNDERTLIHNAHGGVQAGASPWHGEENKVNPATGPLAGIFFLNQAASNQLRRMPVTEGVAKMMTTAFVPVFLPDGPAMTMAACHAILEATPAYHLDFTPDRRAVDLCARAIATGEA